MRKERIALILVVLLIIIAFVFVGYLIISNKKNVSNAQGLTKEICGDAGGHWNECGNKCSLLHQPGNPNYICTQQCETLCECGGEAGFFTCPKGYTCITPKIEIATDLLGYCDKI